MPGNIADRSRSFGGAIYSTIFLEKGVSYGYAWALVIFLVFLIGYIFLLELGPDFKSFTGTVIQATGQKVIVYASILSVMIQSWGLRRNPH